MLVVQRHRGGDTRQLWVLIAINGVIGFMVPQIAWQAHLGGLITGALCAAAIAYVPRGPRQHLLQAAGLAAVLALLAAGHLVPRRRRLTGAFPLLILRPCPCGLERLPPLLHVTVLAAAYAAVRRCTALLACTAFPAQHRFPVSTFLAGITVRHSHRRALRRLLFSPALVQLRL